MRWRDDLTSLPARPDWADDPSAWRTFRWAAWLVFAFALALMSYQAARVVFS